MARVTNRAISQINPTRLVDYVEAVESLRANAGGPIWYRGCSQRTSALLPSLYRPRPNSSASPADLSELEAQLVARFRDRSLPYHSRALDDDLETLFFMQHYAIPTRLLDWTENPFVGLFFALRSAEYEVDHRGRPQFTHDVTVWVLNPSQWNQAALADLSYGGGPLDTAHPHLRAYRLLGEVEKLAAIPVAIYGAHNSQRIVVQQGTFVIFGSRTIPMESLYRRGQSPDGCLTRVTIRRAAIRSFRESLFLSGFTEGSLFPDLDGLGRDLRRLFGFDL